ncbi:hypothetical protein D3C81_1123810 [compost metagenome]
MHPAHPVVHGEPAIGLGVLRIERDRAREHQMRFLRRLRRIIHQPARSHAEVVSLGIPRSLARRRFAQAAEQRLHDLAGDLVLHGEDIVQAAIEAFRPQMIAAYCVDQLGVDAHAPRGASCAALQQVAHAEVLCDPAHVHRLALVGESRVAGDDEQAGDPGQVGDQVFGQPIREGFLLGIVADIHEGQHGYRRFAGQRQGCSLRATELLDGPGEAVADARNCGDPLTAVGSRPQQLAQQRDLDGEIAFLDDRARPCRVHQFGLAEDFAGPFDECRKQLQRAVANGNGDVVAKERSRTRIKYERTKGKARSLHTALIWNF